MRDDVVRLMRSADTFAAVQRVEREGAPREIAERFQELVPDLYWTGKHLPTVIAVAQGGIHYCLAQMESTDADARDYFGTHAKGLAYNLGSFTWPGWDEPGIVPTPCEIAIGLDAARLNFRLALELDKPAEAVQGAHWLLGAHLLAANDPEAALSEFRRCDPEARPLFFGYVLIARVMRGEIAARQEFAEFLAAMPGEGEESRDFNRLQLATARRVFIGEDL